MAPPALHGPRHRRTPRDGFEGPALPSRAPPVPSGPRRHLPHPLLRRAHPPPRPHHPHHPLAPGRAHHQHQRPRPLRSLQPHQRNTRVFSPAGPWAPTHGRTENLHRPHLPLHRTTTRNTADEPGTGRGAPFGPTSRYCKYLGHGHSTRHGSADQRGPVPRRPRTHHARNGRVSQRKEARCPDPRPRCSVPTPDFTAPAQGRTGCTAVVLPPQL